MRELEARGTPRVAIGRLVEQGLLVRLGRGLYAPADFSPAEHHGLALAAAVAPTAGVCLLSALQFHRLTTQAPCPAVPESSSAVSTGSAAAKSVGRASAASITSATLFPRRRPRGPSRTTPLVDGLPSTVFAERTWIHSSRQPSARLRHQRSGSRPRRWGPRPGCCLTARGDQAAFRSTSSRVPSAAATRSSMSSVGL